MGTRKAELTSTVSVPHRLAEASRAGGASGKGSLGIGIAAKGIYAWMTQPAGSRGQPAESTETSARAKSKQAERLPRDSEASDNDSAWSPTIPSVMDI